MARLRHPAMSVLRSLLGKSGVTRTFHFGSDDPEQIFANGNVSRNAAGGLPPGRRNSSLISRGIAVTRRWRQRADDHSIADPPGKPVEDRRLLLNEVAERRSAVHAVKECAQAWPAVARGRNACISQVHMDVRDRNIGDSEPLADKKLAVAELALEIVPECGEFLVDRFARSLLGGDIGLRLAGQ